jgi:hypothetical protein
MSFRTVYGKAQRNPEKTLWAEIAAAHQKADKLGESITNDSELAKLIDQEAAIVMVANAIAGETKPNEIEDCVREAFKSELTVEQFARHVRDVEYDLGGGIPKDVLSRVADAWDKSAADAEFKQLRNRR